MKRCHLPKSIALQDYLEPRPTLHPWVPAAPTAPGWGRLCEHTLGQRKPKDQTTFCKTLQKCVSSEQWWTPSCCHRSAGQGTPFEPGCSLAQSPASLCLPLHCWDLNKNSPHSPTPAIFSPLCLLKQMPLSPIRQSVEGDSSLLPSLISLPIVFPSLKLISLHPSLPPSFHPFWVVSLGFHYAPTMGSCLDGEYSPGIW